MGGCPAIGVSKSRIKTTTEKEFKIRFGLKNDGLVSYTNYFVSLGIPREVTYLRSTVKTGKANAPQSTPTVMDGVVVWRFPKLPSQARVKFSAIFKVDQYCVPESMLAFDISGYQIVNTTIECSTAVSQGVRISCFVQGCLTGFVYMYLLKHTHLTIRPGLRTRRTVSPWRRRPRIWGLSAMHPVEWTVWSRAR